MPEPAGRDHDARPVDGAYPRPQGPRCGSGVEAFDPVAPSPLEAYASFAPVSDSVSAARAFIRETLSRWGSTAVRDDAVLVVSELVTNAIVHAGTAVEVACGQHGGVVRIAVSDHHPARQIPAIGVDGESTEQGGRGLRLSTAIASTWGVEYARARKTVWFALDLPEATPAPSVHLAEPVRPAAPVPLLPDDAAVAVARTGSDGVVLAWDREAARLTGIEPEDAVGRRIGTLLRTSGETDVADIPDLARWQGDVWVYPKGHDRVRVFVSVLRVARGGTGIEAMWLLVPAALRQLLAATVRPAGAEHPLRHAATRTEPPAESLLGAEVADLSYGLDELLQRGVERARDLFQADAAYTLVLTDDGAGLVLRGASGLLLGGRPVMQTLVGAPVAVPRPIRTPGSHADLEDSGEQLPLLEGTGLRSLLHVPLMVAGRFIGVVCVASRTVGRYSTDDAVRLHRATEGFALAVEAARLTELDRRRRGTLSFLAEASDLLAGTLDPSRTLAMLGQLVVPRLGSWCAVHAIGDNGRPTLAHVWHPDETRLDELRAALADVEPPHPSSPQPGPVPWSTAFPARERLRPAARPRDPGDGSGASDETAPPITAELTGSEVLSLPLTARGRRLGVLTLGRPRHDPFRPDTVTLVEDVTRRAALALDNARLYSEQVAASQALQRSLLPPALPEIPGVDTAVIYQAAGEGNEVGGDFYDLFTVRRGSWAFAIGDVCGTGPQAAAVTGLARHSLRLLARRREPVPEVLSQLNAAILDEGRREAVTSPEAKTEARFLTLLYGEMRPRRRGGVRLHLASAGHPLPLRLRPDGSVESVCTPQPLLGVLDDIEFTVETVLLEPGDVLLCVTDGVTERREGSRMLGEDGLIEVLAGCGGLSASAVATRVKRAVETFAPTPASDDMAILVLRALEPPHRPGLLPGVGRSAPAPAPDSADG